MAIPPIGDRKMSKEIVRDPNNRVIWCYGELRCDSNFSVVCEDECNDCIVPGLDEEPESWQHVVDKLFELGLKDMEQIETC